MLWDEAGLLGCKSNRRRVTEVILDPQGMAETRTEEQDLCATRRAAMGTQRLATGQGDIGGQLFRHDRCLNF